MDFGNRTTFGWLKENHPEIFAECDRHNKEQGGPGIDLGALIKSSFSEGGFDWDLADSPTNPNWSDDHWSSVLYDGQMSVFYNKYKTDDEE